MNQRAPERRNSATGRPLSLHDLSLHDDTVQLCLLCRPTATALRSLLNRPYEEAVGGGTYCRLARIGAAP